LNRKKSKTPFIAVIVAKRIGWKNYSSGGDNKGRLDRGIEGFAGLWERWVRPKREKIIKRLKEEGRGKGHQRGKTFRGPKLYDKLITKEFRSPKVPYLIRISRVP